MNTENTESKGKVLHDNNEVGHDVRTIINYQKENLRKEYIKLVVNRRVEMLSVTRILRNRLENPSVSKKANFSVKEVKVSISEDEKQILQSIKKLMQLKNIITVHI